MPHIHVILILSTPIVRNEQFTDTVIREIFAVKKFSVLSEVMNIFSHENSLRVLTYTVTVNIWHMLEVDENSNIATRKFLTKFCKQN